MGVLIYFITNIKYSLLKWKNIYTFDVFILPSTMDWATVHRGKRLQLIQILHLI